MELAGTAVYDVDLTRGVLWVRHGKGNRERVVPLGLARPRALSAHLQTRPRQADTAADERRQRSALRPQHARRAGRPTTSTRKGL